MSATTARLLRPTIALLTLLIEVRYTISRLIASGLLAPYLARFQALRAEWDAVQQREVQLIEALSDALAAVDIADDHLDDFARRFQQVLLSLTGNNRTVSQYTHYFKKPLSDLIRPTLSGQLATMAGWIDSLEEPTTHQKLKDMLPELQTLVQAGKDAEKARDKVKLQIKQFRDIGDRKLLLDHVNGERKELHAALTKLAISDTSLPPDLAAGYFKVADSGEEEPEETIDSLTLEIKHMEDALQQKRDRLAELEKAAETEAQRAEDKAKKQAALAALEAEIEAKKKEAEALKQALGA
jgi:hypothetical protein